MVSAGGLAVVTMSAASPPRVRITLSRRASTLLWTTMAMDMMLAATIVATRPLLDRPSTLTSVVTLGGHPRQVLGLALGAFVLLAALAVAMDGFVSATRVQLGLACFGCAVSIVALAGALSAILLLVTGGLLLGFVARPLRRR